jgi:3-methyl-2-oxobutanoate hydroxymethyltransferase
MLKDRVTVQTILEMKRKHQKIVAVTSYGFTTTQLLNAAGVDIVLIGDSLGMVKLGYSSTLPVTIEDIAYHTRIVAKGNTKALVVADMPYLSYQASREEAVRHSGRMLKVGAEAVKIEGGSEMVPIIRALLAAKIPVMGHIGMTPQSVHLLGGYKVQGRPKAQMKKILADAKALEKAGVFSIVLECVPADLGKKISRAVKVPIIGIGAGPSCDGQILVVDDLLGLTPPPLPRFVKRYADLRGHILRAARDYVREVRSGQFPDRDHSYS